MLRWSINLFRVRGIQLSLHGSFLLLMGYFAYVGYQDRGLPGIAWALALLTAVFTCVVLHELGHSLTARRFGIRVRRILLMPIGGMAEFETIPREPRQELLITGAGPAVNFVLAGVLTLILWGTKTPDVSIDLPSSLGELVWFVRDANVVLGCFNLIPVFPMDGGRILRALLAMRLPYVRATYWAATVGKVLAVIGVAVALWLHLYLVGSLFAFIFLVGEMEYRALRVREEQEVYWERIRARLAAAMPAAPGASPEPPFLERN